MIAHIRMSDHAEQSVKSHSLSVSQLCETQAHAIGLSNTAALAGILHDFGKCTNAFAGYIRNSVEMRYDALRKIRHQNHAPSGAIYAYERWYGESDPDVKLTAQLLALVICGHHTGLHDCLDNYGESAFLDLLESDRKALSYDEAKMNYLSEVCDEGTLDKMFDLACEEIRKLGLGRECDIYKGLYARYLLSVLVDSDRLNAACFEYGEDSEISVSFPDWKSKRACIEAYTENNFICNSLLDEKRSEISKICAECSSNPRGIYQLSVPTGSGKTLSSLRFALGHAERYGCSKVFYVIPYNTILDQNAREIRKALNDDPGILEHHSNVVFENGDSDDELTYKRLTERWDAEIILTSLVHFLDAFYKGNNSNARRMSKLTNSVIVFDEIQSLPVCCRKLFEVAIDFLVRCCGCTILLCTATQPELELSPKPIELVPDAEELFRALRRVEYIPEIDVRMSYDDAARKIAEMLNTGRSTLVILNTRNAAKEVFDNTVCILENLGYITTGSGGSEKNQTDNISDCKTILCVHLSTRMCPAHRLEQIRLIKKFTSEGKLVLCVSTSLIEAGINISFPIVIRSLAGLPSIIQAGGRCNRNMEADIGLTYIWDFSDEKLSFLADIVRGKMISRKLLENNIDGIETDSPVMIHKYFNEERKELKNSGLTSFKYKRWKTNLVEMLGANKVCRVAMRDLHPNNAVRMLLFQSFRTAGREFRVIDDDTSSVIVPYGEGRSIISAIASARSMNKIKHLLARAQTFSVALFKEEFERLEEEKIIYPITDGVYALKDGYYDLRKGF